MINGVEQQFHGVAVGGDGESGEEPGVDAQVDRTAAVRREISAAIAHEVTQPLAAIIASGEASLRWLSRPEPSVDEIRILTENMVSDARRACSIIDSIRSMANGRKLERTLLSLDEVIQEALLFLRHEIQSRGVTVLHFPAHIAPMVLGDRTQLQQVVVNLALNAMQAIGHAANANHKVVVRTAMQGTASLRCTVEDSGPGIDPQHLERIFESFFTTKNGGMGIGLAICRSVVEAHGGCIAADCLSAHGGARFSFTIPFAGSMR